MRSWFRVGALVGLLLPALCGCGAPRSTFGRPAGPEHVVEAQERRDFARVRDSSSAGEWLEFLQRYPASVLPKDVLPRQALRWQDAEARPVITLYLARFPDSGQAPELRAHFAELEFQALCAAGEPRDFEAFAERFPESPRVDEARARADLIRSIRAFWEELPAARTARIRCQYFDHRGQEVDVPVWLRETLLERLATVLGHAGIASAQDGARADLELRIVARLHWITAKHQDGPWIENAGARVSGRARLTTRNGGPVALLFEGREEPESMILADPEQPMPSGVVHPNEEAYRAAATAAACVSRVAGLLVRAGRGHLLADAIADADRSVRRHVTEALRENPDPPAVSVLRAMLSQREPPVLAWTAEALGRLGEREALPELRALTSHEDRHVREAASRAVSAIEDR